MRGKKKETKPTLPTKLEGYVGTASPPMIKISFEYGVQTYDPLVSNRTWPAGFEDFRNTGSFTVAQARETAALLTELADQAGRDAVKAAIKLLADRE